MGGDGWFSRIGSTSLLWFKPLRNLNIHLWRISHTQQRGNYFIVNKYSNYRPNRLRKPWHNLLCDFFNHLPNLGLNKKSSFCTRNFQMHFSVLLQNNCTLITNQLKFIRKGSIGDKPILVNAMSWHRPGDRPVPRQMQSPGIMMYILSTQSRK